MKQGIVVTSANGFIGIEKSIEVLRDGGSPLDAVEQGVRLVESNVNDHTVGRAGIPNLLGQIELDASIMDGSTRQAGAVAAVRGFEHPISIARKVMDHLPHVLLVDRGAIRFAKEMGFVPRNLMTKETKQRWKQGLDERGEGAQDRLEYFRLLRSFLSQKDKSKYLGTVNFIAMDCMGNIATGVSTSGLGWKYPGRVGDSPIIGAGNFADIRYGAAACTGRGELALRSGTARSLVLYMRNGMSITKASETAMADIRDFTDNFGTFMNLICLDKEGNHGGYSGSPGATYLMQTTAMTSYATFPRTIVDLE